MDQSLRLWEGSALPADLNTPLASFAAQAAAGSEAPRERPSPWGGPSVPHTKSRQRPAVEAEVAKPAKGKRRNVKKSLALAGAVSLLYVQLPQFHFPWGNGLGLDWGGQGAPGKAHGESETIRPNLQAPSAPTTATTEKPAIQINVLPGTSEDELQRQYPGCKWGNIHIELADGSASFFMTCEDGRELQFNYPSGSYPITRGDFMQTLRNNPGTMCMPGQTTGLCSDLKGLAKAFRP